MSEELKLIIEDGIEIKSQGIAPKMRAWVSRNEYNNQIRIHEDKPKHHRNGFFYCSAGVIAVQDIANRDNLFPELKKGDCAEYEITFKRVDK